MTGVKSNKDRPVKALEENLSKHRKSAKRGHCTRAEQECCIMRLETMDNSQSTNSAKTLKVFNFYSSLGL